MKHYCASKTYFPKDEAMRCHELVVKLELLENLVTVVLEVNKEGAELN